MRRQLALFLINLGEVLHPANGTFEDVVSTLSLERRLLKKISGFEEEVASLQEKLDKFDVVNCKKHQFGKWVQGEGRRYGWGSPPEGEPTDLQIRTCQVCSFRETRGA